jgi:hypothetical protein
VKRHTAILFILLFSFSKAKGQRFLEPTDTLNTLRFRSALTFSAVTYTGFAAGLYNVWYRKFDQEPFHLFNDLGEWNHLDKAGHFYTSYFQGVLCYKGARWTGLNKRKSMLTGMILGNIFQSTIEVMDGFSSKWGFSLSDMGANLAGIAAFGFQQHYWDEQRISVKISSIPVTYPTDLIFSSDGTRQTTLAARASELYGSNFFEKYLKDYNAQTYWLSFNMHSLLPEGNRWPAWLNLAAGYGAENMFGGFSNTWEKQGVLFSADDMKYPRYRQYYIGFDIDLPRIKTNKPWLKTLFSAVNIFKIPSPALEINTSGQVVFHLLR